MRSSLLFTLVVLTIVLLSSCGTSYFVDPVITPLFTGPNQVNAQFDFSTHQVFYFEGAYSLPQNFLLSASYEPWSGAGNTDQNMTSLALGHFWLRDNLIPTVIGGYGWGQHSFGNNYWVHDPFNNEIRDSAQGLSKFRRFFLEGYISRVSKGFEDSAWLSSSYGFGARADYIDKYFSSDTSVVNVTRPLHPLAADLFIFGSIGIRHIQLYAQLLWRLQSASGIELGDGFVSTAGLQLAF